METKIKEKENQFIKLQEVDGKRIIIERVVQRESMEEDRMRAEKQKAILNQYKEKKAKDLFEKDVPQNISRDIQSEQTKKHSSNSIRVEEKIIPFTITREKFTSVARIARLPRKILPKPHTTLKMIRNSLRQRISGVDLLITSGEASPR
jgi:hypothetical protein